MSHAYLKYTRPPHSHTYNQHTRTPTQFKERYDPSAEAVPIPHIYALAQSASKNLRLLKKNQVCLISGESGQ